MEAQSVLESSSKPARVCYESHGVGALVLQARRHLSMARAGLRSIRCEVKAIRRELYTFASAEDLSFWREQDGSLQESCSMSRLGRVEESSQVSPSMDGSATGRVRERCLAERDINAKLVQDLQRLEAKVVQVLVPLCAHGPRHLHAAGLAFLPTCP